MTPDNGTTVSMKVYVDTRFAAAETAVNAALAAQEKATAAALEAVRDKGTGRGEMWGYVVGAVGFLSLIVSTILLVWRR